MATVTEGMVVYVPIITEDGFGLGVAREGEGGYYKTDYPSVPTWEDAVKWADEGNERMGRTHEQAALIIAHSIRDQRR